MTLTLAGLAASVGAQEVVELQGLPVGKGCPVHQEPVGTLVGTVELALAGRDMDRLAVGIHGGIWIAPITQPGQLLRRAPGAAGFDVRTTVRNPDSDRPMQIDHIAPGPDGVLHVFGEGNHVRVSRTGEVGAVHAVPVTNRIQNAVALPSGGYVLNGLVPLVGHADFPVHIVGDGGAVEGSIGHTVPGLQSRFLSSMEGRRAVALTADGSAIWTARRNAYQLTRWSLKGDRDIEVVRTAEWFQPWTTWIRPTVGPPPPRFRNMALDDAGKVWTLLTVADADFERLPPPSPEAMHEPFPRESRQYDSILEVLDLESREVLAHCRFPGHVALLPGGPYLVSPDITPDGAQVLNLMGLSLGAPPDG